MCLFVRVLVTTVSLPCKNGRTDGDAVWVVDLWGGRRKQVLDGGTDTPREGTIFWRERPMRSLLLLRLLPLIWWLLRGTVYVRAVVAGCRCVGADDIGTGAVRRRSTGQARVLLAPRIPTLSAAQLLVSNVRDVYYCLSIIQHCWLAVSLSAYVTQGVLEY